MKEGRKKEGKTDYIHSNYRTFENTQRNLKGYFTDNYWETTLHVINAFLLCFIDTHLWNL